MTTGGWIDVSHTLENDLPRASTFPSPRYGRFLSMPNAPLNVTELSMVAHVGTHVDAPIHFIQDGESMEQIAIERFVGPGVVLRVHIDEAVPFGPSAVEGIDLIQPGDIVLLNTGWHHYFGRDRYDEHPSLNVELAQLLVDKKVKLVGVDLPTVDLPLSHRPNGFTWPVHLVLLGAGVLVSEHLTNLDPLVGGRAEIVLAPLSIKGADGGPVRGLARNVRS